MDGAAPPGLPDDPASPEPTHTIPPRRSRVHRGRLPWLAPTMQGYRRSWLGPDLLAGITAGAVVIPQAMAYATIADLPVQYGLYTCMVPMLVYAMLGGSRVMSVSTTSTIATLTATTLVAAGIASGSDNPERDLITLTLLVGLILLAARLFRLGSLIENINEATLIGMKVGLGATVALGQMPKLLGVDVEMSGHGFLRSLNAVIAAVPEANATTTLLSATSILLLLLLRRFAPRVPAPLIVVVLGIGLAAFTGLTGAGVALVGDVPVGLPAPSLPTFENTIPLLPGAFAIAIMAFLESASVARGLRVASDPRLDSNRELLATGVANLAGSIFHSLPAAGGFSQSAVNQKAGARSQLATLVTVVLAVAVALFLSPILSLLPQATLAAMVFVAVIGLIDVPAMVRLAKISPVEFWIAIATAAVGLAAGLILAVGTGVFFTLLLVLRELNRPRISTGSPQPGLMVVTLKSPLYTANVVGTVDAIAVAVQDAERPLLLILDASVIQVTSVTVLDTFRDFERELASQQVRLDVAGLPDAATTLAGKTDWWKEMTAQGRIHASVADAVRDVPRP
ncbi:MAG: SulP family inorganic anion transporter [Microbacterium sp.]